MPAYLTAGIILHTHAPEPCYLEYKLINASVNPGFYSSCLVALFNANLRFRLAGKLRKPVWCDIFRLDNWHVCCQYNRHYLIK